MRAKRPRVAWKLVALTPAIFLPMPLIHGLLPVFPWWALDAAGIIAGVSIWSYTERYRWGYTGKTPYAGPGVTSGYSDAPVGLSSHPMAPTRMEARIGAPRPSCARSGTSPAPGAPSPVGFALGRAPDAPRAI